MQFYVIFNACAILPEGEHLVVRNMSKTINEKSVHFVGSYFIRISQCTVQKRKFPYIFNEFSVLLNSHNLQYTSLLRCHLCGSIHYANILKLDYGYL
jgi:hypothetical protein